MNELVKITKTNGKSIVEARELHGFLGSKRQFANWIENRIEDYGFVENQDFEVFNKIVKNSKGGRPSKEYSLSLDMAKELAMVERSDRGREARKYFIAVEKQHKELMNHPVLLELRRLISDFESKVQSIVIDTEVYYKKSDLMLFFKYHQNSHALRKLPLVYYGTKADDVSAYILASVFANYSSSSYKSEVRFVGRMLSTGKLAL